MSDSTLQMDSTKGTATLRCPGCSRRFTVPDFQANRRYKCEPCLAYLEVVVVASFSVSAGQTLSNVKGFESPSTIILEGFACTIPAM